MLPYQEDEKKLQGLLEKLFENETDPQDVKVLRKPGLIKTLDSCCRYSYTDYGG